MWQRVQRVTFSTKQYIDEYMCSMFPFLRKIKEANVRVGCASPPPDVLMKVLSGSVTVSLSMPTLPCPTETQIYIYKKINLKKGAFTK